VSNCSVTENQAVGGAGNTGSDTGSDVSTAYGGGIANFHGNVTVTDSILANNQAVGGAGSPSRDAGDGRGGGLASLEGGTLTVVNCTLLGNQALGGSGGPGANGGNGLGGGLFNGATAQTTLMGSLIVNNQAVGGAGAAGQNGGDGQGVGGGAYIAAGGVVCADDATLITGNHASTSDGDVFGMICDI
jgi:hypothetical protein